MMDIAWIVITVLCFLIGLDTGAGYDFFQNHRREIRIAGWIVVGIFWVLIIAGII